MSSAADPQQPVVSQKDLTFLVTPSEVIFREFVPFQKYESTLFLKNQTNTVKYVRVLAPDSRFFAISEPKSSSSTLKVAAGLSVSYRVIFKPEEDTDYDCDIVCVTETERFVVSVRAISSKGRIDMPSNLTLTGPVKLTTSQVLSVRNIGAKSVQWQLETPLPFNITPKVGSLDVNGALQLNVAFTPPLAKQYSGDAKVTFSTGDVQMIKLNGSGSEVDVHLSTNMVELQRTFISLERQMCVKIINRSDVRVEFVWKAHDTEDEEIAAKSVRCSGLQKSEERVVKLRRGSVSEVKGVTRHFKTKQEDIMAGDIIFEDGVFTVEPARGSVAAKAECEIIITFNPQMATVYHCTAYLDVQGRVGRLPLSMKGIGLGPQCAFSYNALDLTDIFINSIHQYEVQLENRGSIEARFIQIPNPAASSFATKFKFTPNSGSIPPGQSQVVNITFCSDLTGIINETFLFRIQGAKEDLDMHFKGRVIGPTFHFDVEELDFGNVSYNFYHVKTLHLHNTSEISMKFLLKIPEDGLLGKKEFEIIPSTGNILPHGKQKIQVEFLSNTVQEYNAHLVVDVTDVGENLETLPIKATCIVPEISFSRDALDYGNQCFITHPYSLDLEMKNETPLSAKYEVILPSDEDPIRRKADIFVGSGDSKERKGIVHARSVQRVAIVLVGKAVGNVHMTIYIRILGSDKPPHPISVSAKITGPMVSIPNKILDFGNPPVLDERTEHLVLHNNSPIPATFQCKLLSKPSPNAPFSLKVEGGVIEKNSVYQLPINVHLDETMRFTDELQITILSSTEETVKLVAVGKGTTLVPTPPLDKDIDFGDVFTTTTEKKTLVLHNQGRKQIQLQWYYDRSKPKEGDPPLIFTITPERAVIDGKKKEVFTIEAKNDVPGQFAEKLQCKLSKSHKVVFHPTLTAKFHTPILNFSATSLNFTYVFDKDKPEPFRQNGILTMKNISPLPLEFTIKVLKPSTGESANPPFSIDKADHLLREGESATIGIVFDAAYKNDRASHKVSTKLQVNYKDHPQKDMITLTADVQYPNLVMESGGVDFGCTLNDTEVRKTYTITNNSKVPAHFIWCFEDEPVTRPESSTTAAGKTQRVIAQTPLNIHNVFDILPHRGVIKPGETEKVEFVFYGHAGRKVKATAVCQVEGGPDYFVQLTGEASTVQYKVDKSLLDYGAQQYDKWDEKDIWITNSGKVGFPFTVDLSMVQRAGTIEVTPMQGFVKDKVRILVRFCPMVPDRVQDRFTIQVGHFEPQVVVVKGLGLYASLTVTTADKYPVARNERPQFQKCVEESRKALNNYVDPVPYAILAAVTLKGNRANTDENATPTEQDVISEAERMIFRDMITADLKKGVAEPTEEDVKTDVKRRTALNELKYVLSRYVIDFGTVVRGDTKKRSFKLINTSLTPILLSLDKRVFVNSGVTFSIEKLPKLGPQENCVIEVVLSTKLKGLPLNQYSLDIPIDIKGGPLVIIEVRAFIIVPSIELSTDNLDFGTVQVGQCRVMTVAFHNKQSLPCEWSTSVDEGKARKPLDKKNRAQFMCTPARGVLNPGEKIPVEVCFTPTSSDTLLNKVLIKIGHNPKPLEITCRGIAEDLQVALSPCDIVLDPVFPFQIGQCSFQLINKSNCPVEVYSLQMDKTYLVEEEILRNCDALFGESDVLLLPPRGTGASLPDELMEHYFKILMEAEASLTNVDIIPEKGVTQAVPVGDLSPSKTDIVTESNVANPTQLQRMVIVVWGPPKSGVTTLVKKIQEQFALPVLSFDDIILYGCEIDNLEGAHFRSVRENSEIELNPQYFLNMTVRRLNEPDLVNGVIFDSLSHEIIFNDELLSKTLKDLTAKIPNTNFYVIGTLIDEQLISLRTKAMEVAEAERKTEESRTTPLSETVYDALSEADRLLHDRKLREYRNNKVNLTKLKAQLEALEAERASLIEKKAILSIPDQLSKEAEELAAKEAEEAAAKKKPPAKKRPSVMESSLAAPVPLHALTKIERFKRFYLATKKTLSEPQDNFKYELLQCDRPLQECVEATLKSLPPTPTRKSVLTPDPLPISASQNISIPTVIPSTLTDLILPAPITMQRIDRPQERRPLIPAPNFILLTPEIPLDQIAQPGKPDSRKGPKGQAQQQQEQEVKFSKESRWIIPKGASQDLVLQYKSSEITSLEGILSTLGFGVVSSAQILGLNCKATCSYPEIQRDPKLVFARRVKNRADDKFVFKQYVTQRKTFEFGPLLIVKDRKPADAPTTNTDKLKITNSGLFVADVSVLLEQPQDKEKTFFFSPETFKLQPNESIDLTLGALPERVGEIRNVLVLLVKDNPEPIRFEISCIGSKPDVTVNEGKECLLDFNRLLIRRTEEKVMKIKNVSFLPITWKIVGTEKLPQEYKIDQLSGTLESKAETSVKVAFCAERANLFNCPLKIEVTDSDAAKTVSETLPLNLKCEAYDVILECTREVDFKVVRVGEEKKETIKLLNKGLYDVKFQIRIPKKYADVFIVTPAEGTLKGQAGAKEASVTNVEVVFKSHKEMQVGKKGPEFECAFIEPLIGEMVYPPVPIHVKAESYYNKYQIKPSQINFGPCLYKQKKQATFDIVNQGCFELRYRMFSFKDGYKKDEAPPEPVVAAKKPAGKRRPSAGTGAGGDITLGAFTVTPAYSCVPIGGIQTVTVSLNPEGSQNFHEIVGIHIEDRDPTDHPDGLPFELEAESCVPGIIADLDSAEAESIFEEQQIISRFDPFKKLSSVFARDDKVFSFGVVISGKRVSERFRITNPNKVACTVHITIQPRGDAQDAKSAADAFDIQGQKTDGGKITIPPHEHKYVVVGFTPIGLNTFSAMFSAAVENGFDVKTKHLKFEIRGEGSLPDVTVELPPPPQIKQIEVVDVKGKGKPPPPADKKKTKEVEDSVPPNSLIFPKTIVGTKLSRPVTVKNVGDLPATIRFAFPTGGQKIPFSFPSKNEDITIPPQGREKFLMFFEPTEVGEFKAKLNMTVQDNHYEDVTINVIGEGAVEEIIYEDIDENSHNTLTLGDCMIGVPKSRKFVLRNFSAHVIRFAWSIPSDKFQCIPALGHIPARCTKEVVIKYCSNDPEQHDRTSFTMQCAKINVTAAADGGIIDWDDRATMVSWEPQATDSRLLKKVIEPQKEPEYTVVEGTEAFKKELLISCVCDFAMCEVTHATAGMAQQLLSQGIAFSRTKLFQKRTYQFGLKNTGKVNVENTWSLVDGYGSTPSEPASFTINPRTEIIPAGQQSQVTVTFCPTDVGDLSLFLVSQVTNASPTSPTIRIPLSGSSECPLVHFDLPECDHFTSGRRDPELPGPKGFAARELPQELQVLEFVSRGVKVTNSKRFVVINPTNMSYEFEWTDETQDSATAKMFTCMTQRGIIHSGKQYEMQFQFTPESLTLREAFYKFTILGKLSVMFCIVGKAVEPDVYFNRTKITFDKIQIGAKGKQTIMLENHETVAFPFNFDRIPAELDSAPVLSVTPVNGTVPPNSTQPIEIVFSPQSEDQYNYNLVCRVKKKTTPITCNVKGEGFTIHEQVTLRNADGMVNQLSSSTPNVVDLGRVYLKETAKRQFIIVNDGRYQIDYKFARGECPFLSLSNELGTVHPGAQEVIDMIFTPTKETALNNYKVSLKITNGNTYVVLLNSSAVQPNVVFSTKSYDFGPCFVYSPGAVPSVYSLVISNYDVMDVALECDYENKEYLEVDMAPLVIKGKKENQAEDKREVQIRFMPREVSSYKEIIKFNINGLYTVPVTISGEGTQARVELVGLPSKMLNFGAVRVGDKKTLQAKLACFSKIPTSISFENTLTAELQKYQLSMNPTGAFIMRPKETRMIDVTFTPTTRMRPFSTEMQMEVVGQKCPLFSVSATCHGVEVHLDVKTIQFGQVVLGTQVCRQVTVMNTGDIGVQFQWPERRFEPEYTITPVAGFIAAHSEIVCEIVYHPTEVGKEAKRDNIELKISEGYPSLFLSIVNTACIAKPTQAEVIKFQCPVRLTATQTIQIKNDSTDLWTLKPSFDNPLFTGPENVVVKPKESTPFVITYSPTASTKLKPDQANDTCNLFFPLPTGSAYVYTLEGTADNPTVSSPALEREVIAKTMFTEKLVVKNWMKTPQRFAVTMKWSFDPSDESIVVKTVPNIDVPADSNKEYRYTFYSYKEVKVTGTITFTNEQTKEFQYYQVQYVVKPPKEIASVSLKTPARQQTVESLTLTNPLDKQVTLNLKCDHPDVIIPTTMPIPGKSNGKISITYFPQMPTKEEVQTKLIATCPELGEFPYSVKLTALQPAPEKGVRVQCALGQMVSTTLRLVHYSKAPVDFTCKFADPKQVVFFKSNTQMSIKAPPCTDIRAGQEVTFDITFEPCRLGDARETFEVSSPVAGTFQYSLVGTCLPPQRQGPLDIKPGQAIQIPFKNVFADTVTFNMFSDSPQFIVAKPSEAIPGKKSSTIAVTYKADDAQQVIRGKLSVQATNPVDGSPVAWTYYLRGVRADGKETTK
eukprot:PhF_6_TR15973/c0_g1_i1/m.24996/K17570/HYDIN; hydrocephalus-inducing protein